MKRIFFWLGIIFLVAACSSQKNLVQVPQLESDEIAEDSVEYELITFDTQFETWYAMHDSPAFYRSKQFYESWNMQYVSAWNNHANDPRRSRFFQTIIGYNPTIEYGFELNHKLFYYFQYVENVLKISVMPNSPRLAGI